MSHTASTGTIDDPTPRSTMTHLERRFLRRFLEIEWEKTRADYYAAGAPFGPGRGLEIWVEYGQLTTLN